MHQSFLVWWLAGVAADWEKEERTLEKAICGRAHFHISLSDSLVVRSL